MGGAAFVSRELEVSHAELVQAMQMQMNSVSSVNHAISQDMISVVRRAFIPTLLTQVYNASPLMGELIKAERLKNEPLADFTPLTPEPLLLTAADRSALADFLSAAHGIEP